MTDVSVLELVAHVSDELEIESPQASLIVDELLSTCEPMDWQE